MKKTIEQLIRCAEREVVMRKAVYPRRVEFRGMSQANADHEIDCMAQIVELLKTMPQGKESTSTHKSSLLIKR